MRALMVRGVQANIKKKRVDQPLEVAGVVQLDTRGIALRSGQRPAIGMGVLQVVGGQQPVQAVQLRHDDEDQRFLPVQPQKKAPATQPQRVLPHAVAKGAGPVNAQVVQPAKEQRVELEACLNRVNQIAPEVVGIAAKLRPVGACDVARAVAKAVVVGHMGGPEHKSGVALQQRQPVVGGAIGPAAPPHAHMGVVVVNHANA